MSIDYSNVQGEEAEIDGTVTWGTGNIGDTGDDPLFNLAGPGDYSLTCGSPCINTGAITTTDVPADIYDINRNTQTTTEKIDLERMKRIVGIPSSPRIDMGCLEKPTANIDCPGEVDGIPSELGVNIDDLVALITNWGPCSGTPCIGDIYPPPCGDGVVSIDDLNLMRDNWGCGATGTPGEFPQTLDACIAACLESREDFGECLLACLEALNLYNP